MNPKDHSLWKEAQRRCNLSDDDVRMAKELGFQPHSLIKNIPAPSQKWKAPVRDWVRQLYEEKIGSRQQAARPVAPAPLAIDPAYPWPDRPEIPEFNPEEPNFDEESEPEWNPYFEEPDAEDQNTLMLRRQCLFRWGAQFVAITMSQLPEVQRVAAFGAVASPLEMEVPRFRQFQRRGIEVWHECADLDLAVWLSNVQNLKELKRALNRGLDFVHDTAYGGVAHHQVDVHIFDAEGDAYRGRLCFYGECPKPGKQDCLVPGCGAAPFLRQFARFRWSPGRFQDDPKVTLFDRASGFLVRPPVVLPPSYGPF